MADSVSNSASSPAPPRKRRRWLKAIGILLLLLILLVLLAPTLLSTGPARSLILGKVNDRLSGRLEIADWSVGWFGGTTVEGVKLFDEKNLLILSVGRIHTPLSILSAVRGNYALGDIVIDDPNLVLLKIDANHKTNYQQVFAPPASQTSPPPPPSPTTTQQQKTPPPPPPPPSPIRLPNFSGTLTLNRLRGTIVADSASKPLLIDPSTISIAVADINQPVHDSIDLHLKIGDMPAGAIRLDGTVDAVQNNLLDPNQIFGQQKLKLQEVNLEALGPVLTMAQIPLQCYGNAAGELQLSSGRDGQTTADGNLQVSGLAVTGELLGKDAFRTASLTAPIHVSRKNAGGVSRIKVSDTAVIFDQGKLMVQAEGRQEAILAALQAIPAAVQRSLGLPPPADYKPVHLAAGDGSAMVSLDLDIAAVAKMLPNLLRLQQGTSIQSGQLSHKTTLTFQQDQALIQSDTDLQRLTGTANHEPVNFEPIHASAVATATAGDDPQLRNIQLGFQSVFASAQATAPTLFNPQIKVTFDLDKLQQQARPFFRIETLKLAGNGDFTLGSTGDWVGSGNVSTTADLKVTNLEVGGIKGMQAVHEPRLLLHATGDLHRGNSDVIDSVKNVVVGLVSGDPNAPTLSLALSADLNLAGKPKLDWRIRTARLDLPILQQQFGSMLKGLAQQNLSIRGGAVSLAGAGKFQDASLTFDPAEPLTASVEHLTVHRMTADGSDITVVRDDGATLQLAGSIETGTGDVGLTLSQLSLSDTAGLVGISKLGDADVRLQMRGQSLSMSGRLSVQSDLKGLNDLSRALSADSASSLSGGGAAGELRSAHLSGAIDLSAAADGQPQAAADFQIPDLSVTTSGAPIPAQHVTFSMQASAAADGSSISMQKFDLASALFHVAATEPVLMQLPVGGAAGKIGPFEILQRAGIELDVPDLKGAWTVLTAFQSQPMNFTAGSVHLKLHEQRNGSSTTVTVDDLDGKEVTFVRTGGLPYAAAPFSVKLAAMVDAAFDPQKPQLSPLDQIRQVKVTQLSGDLGVAQLSMPEPIVVTGLSATPTATGSVSLTGKIESAARLAEALQGLAAGSGYPYQGNYVLTEHVTPDNAWIKLLGGVQITDFQVLQGQTTQFKEDKLDLSNDLAVNPSLKTVQIHSLSVDMASSGALKLAIKGTLADWEKQRNFQDVSVDADYDLAKLWSIVKPMLSAQQQTNLSDLVIAGKAHKTFTLSGSLPAEVDGKPVAFSTAVKSLVAAGSISVDSLQTRGMTIKIPDLPVSLKDGVARTVYADKPEGQNLPAVATCNSGTMDLGGFSVDLTGPEPRLSAPDNHKILVNVALDPVMAAQTLGKILPLFVDPKQASGQVNLTAVHCDRLPLSALITSDSAQNDGKAEFLLTVDQLKINSPILSVLQSAPGVNAGQGGQGIQGMIRDGHFSLAKGVATQNMVLQLGSANQYLHFSGNVLLNNQQLKPFVIGVPSALFRLDRNLAAYLPAEVPIPLEGTMTNLKLSHDWAKIWGKMIADATGKAILGQATGSGNGGGATTQPSGNNSVNNLLNLLGGQPKKKKK